MGIKRSAAAIVALGLLVATAGLSGAEAREGCGPGFHRGGFGACRPNFGFHPGWHRGWHGGGWHRGWHRGGWHRGGWHRHWR